MIIKRSVGFEEGSLHAFQEKLVVISLPPPEAYLRVVSSCHSDHISDLILESDLDVNEHGCVDPYPRPLWVQYILHVVGDLVGDLVNLRKTIS
jgi:hypothetical protein